jgi:hypothetical protein
MNANIQPTLTMQVLADLDKSGLTKEDIPIVDFSESLASSVNIPMTSIAYGIHYFNLEGKRLPYYRVRILSAKEGEPKYKQIKATKNHIYFPQNFQAAYTGVQRKFVVWTEGEKKAAALCKYGIPAVACSGVDAWKNTTLLIPKNVEQAEYPHNKGMIMLKAAPEVLQEYMNGFAEGFDEFVELMLKHKSQVIIIYDNDGPDDNPGVQKAAARLGFELRNRGIPTSSIRQAYLPNVTGEKTGIDDFLVHPDGGIDRFKKILHDVLQKASAFPVYPNIKEYLAKTLSKARITRKMYQEVSLALVTDLDRRGKRMYSPDEGQLYYFDQNTKHLMKVQINEGIQAQINETEFGRLLYKEYDVSPIADTKVLSWLGAQIAGEEPIENINPSRIIARPRGNEDCVRFQLNDGQFVKVTGNPRKPFEILDNGDDSTLFASETMLPINGEELKACLEKVMKMPLEPWWFDVMRDVKLKERGYAAMAMGLLYYISPWLYRWRGTQLPIEMVCGESGSGKSTLVSLRLNILTGQASLKNAPTDLKDWYASITKSGGMHVTDNLHFTDKQLAQRMSDELCRLVTEPNPAIEQRKYFTNADVIKFPINAIFSFTAIKQPFNNADLIQRSFILELDKVSDAITEDGEVKDYAFDGHWLQHQLDRFGGRNMWVAHHLWVLHKFFHTVEKEWDPGYRAKYRLINLEQCLKIMARVFKLEDGGEWLPDYLSTTTNKTIRNSDWTLDGLKAYADHRRKHELESPFTAADIVQWCSAQEDYEENHLLSNARTLGRYLQTAKFNIATIAGIVEAGKSGNKQFYNVTKPKPKT